MVFPLKESIFDFLECVSPPKKEFFPAGEGRKVPTRKELAASSESGIDNLTPERGSCSQQSYSIVSFCFAVAFIL